MSCSPNSAFLPLQSALRKWIPKLHNKMSKNKRADFNPRLRVVCRKKKHDGTEAVSGPYIIVESSHKP